MSGADIVIGNKHLVRWFGGQVFGRVLNVEQTAEDRDFYMPFEENPRRTFRMGMRIVVQVESVDGSTVTVDSGKVGDIAIIELTNVKDSVY